MGGIDSTVERSKIDYQPQLKYDLPYQEFAASYTADEVMSVVDRARAFDPAAVAALLDEVTGQYNALREQLLAVAPEAAGLLQSTLDVSRGFLENQQAFVGEADTLFEAWQRSLLNYTSRRDDFDRIRKAVPWDAVQYPELYPEMQGEVNEFWRIKNQFDGAATEMRQLSRRVFTALDGLNLLRTFYSSLRAALPQMVPSSPKIVDLPDAARQVLDGQTDNVQRRSDLATARLFLITAGRQQDHLNRIVAVQKRQLVAGQVRDWLADNNPGREVRELLEQAVRDTNAEYKKLFLDAHRMYALVINVCQRAVAAGTAVSQLEALQI